MAFKDDTVGSILGALDRPAEAIVHHRRSLELFQELVKRNPDDGVAQRWVGNANFRIGNNLRAQGQVRQALEEHYLPYAKKLFERQVDQETSSDDLHTISVAHGLVGASWIELDQPADALPHFQQELRCKKTLIEREPNNARHARDWSTVHCDMGSAQVALGRFEEGITNLQVAVRLGENLVARDPSNEAFQFVLIHTLHAQATGYAKAASRHETRPARRAELWRHAIASLSRCQQKLGSSELERANSWLNETATEIAQELDEARSALTKLEGNPGSKRSKP